MPLRTSKLAAQLIDPEKLQRAVADRTPDLLVLKQILSDAGAALDKSFAAGGDVNELVPARAWAVEQVLVKLWGLVVGDEKETALVAVGGFGRGEMHPFSDVDLLILVRQEPQGQQAEAIQSFLTCLWDIGLDIGQSVRTPKACFKEGRADISVATNMMESRLMAGSRELYQKMRRQTAPSKIWPGRAFFEAKFAEQQARHQKYDDTAYALEPNVKEAPGGLRDIQMVGWVAKRHYKVGDLKGLVKAGFLEPNEYQALKAGQTRLWEIRYALHVLAGRAEDRLLFDYQLTLARDFGYSDEHELNLAVEQFMQSYYRNAMQLERLNERLLQLFQEDILSWDWLVRRRTISDNFESFKGFLQVSHDQVFEQSPKALLETFLILQSDTDLLGVRASTVRLIRNSLHLIDESFRADPEANRMILELFRRSNRLTAQLSRMNRYGLLAALIPAFAQIVGRMQYDLFHAFTVDQHTFFVIRNMRRFSGTRYAADFPIAHQCFKRIDQPELLYLAGLFHDIAKGRGGDHSELGEQEALAFCERLGLPGTEARLVGWLVRNHLQMSVIAQRKDLSDPEVIARFAANVGDTTRLDYLYLLTVADIWGTSPKLWTSWKGGLLAQLFRGTQRFLSRESDATVDQDERGQAQGVRVRERLVDAGFESARITEILEIFPLSDRLRFRTNQLVWQISGILDMQNPAKELVLLRPNPDRAITEIFLYAHDQDGLFSRATSAMDRLGLNILEAKILDSTTGRSIDFFQVLDPDSTAGSETRYAEIRQALYSAIGASSAAVSSLRVPSRHQRNFARSTQVEFLPVSADGRMTMELATSDRNGLLSEIALAIEKSGCRIHAARIATFGDRVEDFFSISDKNSAAAPDESRLEQLKDDLIARLDRDSLMPLRPSQHNIELY